MDTQQKLTRWRLILGAQTDSEFRKLDPDFKLDRRGLALDAALAAVYGGIGEAAGGGAGLGPSHPQITKWLKDIRSPVSYTHLDVYKRQVLGLCGIR